MLLLLSLDTPPSAAVGAALSLLLLLAAPAQPSTTPAAVTGSPACLNASVCNGEGEMCSEASHGGDVNNHSCVCWTTYYRAENSCQKLLFYSLTLPDLKCEVRQEYKTAKDAACISQLEKQVKEYIDRQTIRHIKSEILVQETLHEGSSHVGVENDTSFRPTAFILLAARVSLNFSDMCETIQRGRTVEARCNGSLEGPSAEILCQSDSGNPCDLLTTQCRASAGTVACVCKQGYSRVPGNQWMCKAKCSPSEYWNDNIKTCVEKCHKTTCRNSGECIPTDDGHMCRCPSGYDGIDCGHWSGKKFEDLKWITVGIGLATLMLMLLLVTVVSVICCTDRCQKLLYQHRHLGKTDDLERLSCFSPAARSALKDYDTSNDNLEMSKQKTDHQIQKDYLATSDTNVSGKASKDHTSPNEHAVGGSVNESYIPEADFDLDVSEDKDDTAISHSRS